MSSKIAEACPPWREWEQFHLAVPNLRDNTGHIAGTQTVRLCKNLHHHLTKMNRIFLFWLAFIFTRPFGATFGDFLTKSSEQGGLAPGTMNATLFSIVLMVFFPMAEQKQQYSNKMDGST